MNSHSNHFFRTAIALTALSASLAAGMAHAQATDSTEVKKTERVASDSWITTKIKSELLANSGTKGFDVHVKTMHGTATLTGKLPSQDAIDQVKATAQKVQGVKDVDTSGLIIAAK
jgi:hyperosmotically inducible protein